MTGLWNSLMGQLARPRRYSKKTSSMAGFVSTSSLGRWAGDDWGRHTEESEWLTTYQLADFGENLGTEEQMDFSGLGGGYLGNG